MRVLVVLDIVSTVKPVSEDWHTTGNLNRIAPRAKSSLISCSVEALGVCCVVRGLQEPMWRRGGLPGRPIPGPLGLLGLPPQVLAAGYICILNNNNNDKDHHC